MFIIYVMLILCFCSITSLFGQYPSFVPPRSPVNNLDPLPSDPGDNSAYPSTIQDLTNQLDEVRRQKAIVNSHLAIVRGTLTTQYAELKGLGYFLLGAGGFVMAGADLAAIGTAITVTSSRGSNRSNNSSMQPGNGQSMSVRHHKTFMGTFAGHRNHRRILNTMSRNNMLQTARVSSGMDDTSSNQLAPNAALAALIVVAVADIVTAVGSTIRASAYVPLLRRSHVVQVIANNNLMFALYTDEVAQRIEALEMITTSSNNLEHQRYPRHSSNKLHSSTESNIESIDQQSTSVGLNTAPDRFYGTWQAVSDEPRLDERFWRLTAALTSQLKYDSDRLKQSVHRIEITPTSLVTYLETTSQTGQILLSSTASPQVKFRYVLKQGVGSQLNPEAGSLKGLSVDAIDTVGIFLGWDDEPAWEWYRYNATTDSLTDINHKHVFQRQ